MSKPKNMNNNTIVAINHGGKVESTERNYF